MKAHNMNLSTISSKLFACLLLIVAPGCFKKRIHVSSTAYADRQAVPHGFAPGTSFAIAQSSHEGEEAQHPELLDKELSQKASILLKERGYRIKKLKAADYCLMLDYGSSCEKKVTESLRYIPGKTVGTTTTTIDCFGHCHLTRQETELPGKFVFVPEEYIDCTKFLSCTIYPAKEFASAQEQLPGQLWRAESWTVDQNTNLREYLDFLLIQNIDLLGAHLQTAYHKTWYEGDERVQALRDIYTNGSF